VSGWALYLAKHKGGADKISDTVVFVTTFIAIIPLGKSTSSPTRLPTCIFQIPCPLYVLSYSPVPTSSPSSRLPMLWILPKCISRLRTKHFCNGQWTIADISPAGLLGFATEEAAMRLGQTMGGLLNATLGNAVELIVAILALIKVSR